mmetsp:Transcript_54415/g.115591  ORF Transcript_54415/g.115591 Transcript_54415/m.115591 type:complete len:232 (+) Transcript_54415:581-1276(+)
MFPAIGVAVIGRDVQVSLVESYALSPGGRGAKMELPCVCAALHIIRVNVVAAHPVGHPDEIVVGVDREGADLHLSGVWIPGKRFLPFERLRIVDDDLNVVAAAIFKPFNSSVNVPFVVAYIPEVVRGFFKSVEWVGVVLQHVPIHIVNVERQTVADEVMRPVGGDALPPLDVDNFLQLILPVAHGLVGGNPIELAAALFVDVVIEQILPQDKLRRTSVAQDAGALGRSKEE